MLFKNSQFWINPECHRSPQVRLPPWEGGDPEAAPSAVPAQLGFQGLGMAGMAGGGIWGSPQMVDTKSLLAVCFAAASALPRAAQGNQNTQNGWFTVSLAPEMTVESERLASDLRTITHLLCDLHASLASLERLYWCSSGQLESLVCQRLDPTVPGILAAPSRPLCQLHDERAVLDTVGE